MTDRFAAGSGAEIRIETDGAVATLVVDRPAQRNALSIPVCEQINDMISDLEANPDVRALVVTGSGPKSFIAGADINELVTYTPAQGYRHIEVGHKLFTRIENLAIPTLASVNGYCLGGGLEIAMACDIRLASSNAKFGLPEINIAMVPGWGGTERLQRLIGQSRAAAMTITGEMISIDEAITCGLVYRQFETVQALRPAPMNWLRVGRLRTDLDAGDQADAAHFGWTQPRADPATGRRHARLPGQHGGRQGGPYRLPREAHCIVQGGVNRWHAPCWSPEEAAGSGSGSSGSSLMKAAKWR